MKKIYGIYPGSIKYLEEIDNLNEVELFLAIQSLNNYILTSKELNECDLQDDEYALEYLINKTKKFGVEIEKDKNGKIIKNGDFLNWCEYYMKYFTKVLSREEFRKFLDLKSRGYNVSKYLPNGSYLNYKKKILMKNKTYIKIPQTL